MKKLTKSVPKLVQIRPNIFEEVNVLITKSGGFLTTVLGGGGTYNAAHKYEGMSPSTHVFDTFP